LGDPFADICAKARRVSKKNMQILKIMVVFLAFAQYDCVEIVEIDEVAIGFRGDDVRRTASPGPRRIRGFVGGPSDPTVAHHMAINVSEHIKQASPFLFVLYYALYQPLDFYVISVT
jgi:hypothetical protein